MTRDGAHSVVARRHKRRRPRSLLYGTIRQPATQRRQSRPGLESGELPGSESSGIPEPSRWTSDRQRASNEVASIRDPHKAVRIVLRNRPQTRDGTNRATECRWPPHRGSSPISCLERTSSPALRQFRYLHGCRFTISSTPPPSALTSTSVPRTVASRIFRS